MYKSREKAREVSRAWYKKNKERHDKRVAAYNKARRDEVAAFISWLKTVPCKDCGASFPPYCMDFDHVKGKKVQNIGSSNWWNLEALFDELLKCEIVCANCHRIRTHKK